MMRIGVVSDTHGKVPARVHEALRGVSLILHAGDIGGEGVIAELETIARVVAVRGNTDTDLGPPQYPDSRRLTLESVDILLVHKPEDARMVTPPPALIIHGHTHVPRDECEGQTRWFNPGTAGKRQFGHNALTVGLLTLDKGTVMVDIIEIGE